MFNAGTVAVESVTDVMRFHNPRRDYIEVPSIRIKLTDGRIVYGVRTSQPEDVSTTELVMPRHTLQPFIDRLLSEGKPFISKTGRDDSSMFWSIEWETVHEP